MTNVCRTRAASAPPIDPDIHRRIHLRRFGIQGATARLIGELAFGPARDGVLVGAVADTGSLTEGTRQ